MSLYVDTTEPARWTSQAGESPVRHLPAAPDQHPPGLQLNKPIYERTAAYGHFGRKPEKDGGFSWERTDLADALEAQLPLKRFRR